MRLMARLIVYLAGCLVLISTAFAYHQIYSEN